MSISFSPAYNVYEEHDSQRENWGIDGRNCSATLRCDWSDRHFVAEDLLVNNRAWPYGSWANPPRAMSVAIRPDGASAQSNSQGLIYQHALLDVDYGFLAEEDGGDLVSESIEPTAEFIKLNHRDFRWNGPTGEPLTAAQAPGVVKRGMNLVRTYYNLQTVPTSLLTLAGTVNHAAYTSNLLGLTFAKETLLFGEPSLNRTISFDGTEGFTLSLKFAFNPGTWNKFYRTRTSSYAEIYIRGGSSSPYKPYQLADFSDFLV